MDLADLPEALSAVVFQWCPLVEVHCHRELPGLDLPGGTGSGVGDDLSPGLSPPPSLKSDHTTPTLRQLQALLWLTEGPSSPQQP